MKITPMEIYLKIEALATIPLQQELSLEEKNSLTRLLENLLQNNPNVLSFDVDIRDDNKNLIG